MRKTLLIIIVIAFAGVLTILEAGKKIQKAATIKKEIPVRGISVLIDPRLRPYYIEVAQRLNLEGINPNRQKGISITIGSLPKGVLGIAMGMFIDEVVNVIISTDYWFKLSESQKRALIWHELAHDMFNVEHGSVEIMSTSMAKINTNNIDELIKELIKHIQDVRKEKI